MQVMDAYLSGLEQRLAAGLPVDQIASVASFFVSRVDTKVDAKLQTIIQTGGEASSLLGKAAIANARLAYARFEEVFASPRFVRLQAKGARRQRPLWASTSTKNPAYRDVVYIEELIGPDTVNTVPPQTLNQFREHGIAQLTIRKDLDGAKQSLASLESLGIHMEQVTTELEVEGVKAFADAFTALLKTIDERRLAILANGQ
jgi:transaldolase